MLPRGIPLTALVVWLAAVQAAIAGEPALSDRSGRWICDPAQAEWPYVLIDFEEDAYRRCDQNTCVTYPILSVTVQDNAATVRFAPHGAMTTQDHGGPYAERLDIGAGVATRTSGTCAFEANEGSGKAGGERS